MQPQFQPGKRWLYWEKNDPLWWRIVSIVCVIFCFGAAMDTAGRADWGIAVLMTLLAIGFASTSLADTGGWGMYRYSPGRRAWCFALGGSRGVMVYTKKDRRFLISSYSPEKLAAAAEAARIAANQ